MNMRHRLSVSLRRAIIPVMALVALLAGLGVAVQDAAFAGRGAVRVEISGGTGSVELYGASHALVIGIDAYRAGWPRLSNAVRDAELVAEALEGQGFSVTLEKNLDSGALKDAFARFFTFKGQDPQARLLVWFAGHGHTLDGEGFLVPADAPRAERIAQFKYKALSLRRFGEFVRIARAKHALGVFDACFAGTVFTTQRSLPPPAITHHTTLPVRQFVSSGDENQEVSDDGRFRKLFIRALKGEAPNADANRDGYLTGSELGMFLSDRVTNLTRARQTPHYGKLRDEDWDRGDFVFVTEPPPSFARSQAPASPMEAGASGEEVPKRELGNQREGRVAGAPRSEPPDNGITGSSRLGRSTPATQPSSHQGTSSQRRTSSRQGSRDPASRDGFNKPSARDSNKQSQLIVRSNVFGDTVTIDGKPMGATGPAAHTLTPGEHTVRVEKEGFEPFETHSPARGGGKRNRAGAVGSHAQAGACRA